MPTRPHVNRFKKKNKMTTKLVFRLHFIEEKLRILLLLPRSMLTIHQKGRKINILYKQNKTMAWANTIPSHWEKISTRKIRNEHCNRQKCILSICWMRVCLFILFIHWFNWNLHTHTHTHFKWKRNLFAILSIVFSLFRTNWWW